MLYWEKTGFGLFLPSTFQPAANAAQIHLNLEGKIQYMIWAASCEKGPDDIFCPFLVLSFFAHFIPK